MYNKHMYCNVLWLDNTLKIKDMQGIAFCELSALDKSISMYLSAVTVLTVIILCIGYRKVSPRVAFFPQKNLTSGIENRREEYIPQLQTFSIFSFVE